MSPLLLGEYIRSFVCDGCFRLSEDGQEYRADHEAPHTVWVQDVVMPLQDGSLVIWKDSSCEEVGQPCCLYQSPCTIASLAEILREQKPLPSLS